MSYYADRDWLQWSGANVIGGFLFGSFYGAKEAYYKFVRPVIGQSNYPRMVAWSQIANYTGRNGMEFTLLGVLYSVGTLASSTVRSKDDELNNGVGGMLIGAYFGLKRGTVHHVFTSTVAIGVVAIMNAYIVKEIRKTVDDPENPNFKYLMGRK